MICTPVLFLILHDVADCGFGFLLCCLNARALLCCLNTAAMFASIALAAALVATAHAAVGPTMKLNNGVIMPQIALGT